MADRIPVTDAELAREFRLRHVRGSATDAITNPALRIHATAVTAVLRTDKMLTPDVDAWWPPYLRSVLTQTSRLWFTSTSKNDPTTDDRDAQFALSALAVVRVALGLPSGANLTTDVVQAALDLRIEQAGKANAVITDLVDQVRDVAGRHRITVGTDPELHAAIDAADAFVFSRELSQGGAA